eukprot:766400-Hanusia_phi.AAC.12
MIRAPAADPIIRSDGRASAYHRRERGRGCDRPSATVPWQLSDQRARGPRPRGPGPGPSDHRIIMAAGRGRAHAALGRWLCRRGTRGGGGGRGPAVISSYDRRSRRRPAGPGRADHCLSGSALSQ